MRSILYYITGHGFGHAVRSAQVIRALQQAAPDLRVHVRTTAPGWLFDSVVPPVSYTHEAIDVGIVQPNGLEMDFQSTLDACREMRGRMTQLIDQETAFVTERSIDLIVGDIPPLAFEIAARAHVPSVAVTNFTWDVIYRAHASAHPELEPLIAEMTASYSKATLALTLPYPCDTAAFERCEPIPWISRTSTLTRGQARSLFCLPPRGTIVLLSFGGLGFTDIPWQQLTLLHDFFFVTTGPVELAHDNCVVLTTAQRRYVDLLPAVDAVVTKPGYGMVADILAHRLPVLYTERGDFPEYPRLVHALAELATAEFIPQGDLRAGRIRPYLLRLFDKSPNWPPVALDGAAQAAEKILRLLDGGVG